MLRGPCVSWYCGQELLRTCSGAGERMPSRDTDPACPGSPVAPVPKTG